MTQQEHTNYLKIWDGIKDDMMQFHTRLHEAIRLNLDKVNSGADMKLVSNMDEGGDEELKIFVDYSLRDNDKSLIGVDVILTDGRCREDLPGCGIIIELIGYGGQHLGAYIPKNFSPEAFTEDIDELKRRIEHANVNEFAVEIVEHLARHRPQDRPKP